MTASITVYRLDPERMGEWRAFYRELSGPRRADWAQSQRRRGIRREAIWLLEEAANPRAVILIEGVEPNRASRILDESDDPFDLWYRSRLDDLVGEPIVGDPVFDSRPRPGIWRGWKRRTR